MKKILMMAAIAVALGTRMQAQITKHNWLVGGSVDFSSSRSGYNGGFTTLNDFTVTPKAGYFFIDKLAAGLNMNVDFSYDRYKDASLTTHSNQQLYQLGPFVRYYFLNTAKMVNIMAELGDEYGVQTVPNSAAITGNTFSIVAGPVIFLNSSVAVEWRVGYSMASGYNNSVGSQRVFSTGIGLQIHLERDR